MNVTRPLVGSECLEDCLRDPDDPCIQLSARESLASSSQCKRETVVPSRLSSLASAGVGVFINVDQGGASATSRLPRRFLVHCTAETRRPHCLP